MEKPRHNIPTLPRPTGSIDLFLTRDEVKTLHDALRVSPLTADVSKLRDLMADALIAYELLMKDK